MYDGANRLTSIEYKDAIQHIRRHDNQRLRGDDDRTVQSSSGMTDLFIYPPHDFRVSSGEFGGHTP